MRRYFPKSINSLRYMIHLTKSTPYQLLSHQNSNILPIHITYNDNILMKLSECYLNDVRFMHIVINIHGRSFSCINVCLMICAFTWITRIMMHFHWVLRQYPWILGTGFCVEHENITEPLLEFYYLGEKMRIEKN